MSSSSSQRGTDPAHHQFLLEDLEAKAGLGVDTGVDAVGAVARSLLGLTILPASDPLVASYGFVEMGAGPCPMSAPAHAQGARPPISASFLVALGLMEPPSLWSAPVLRAVGEFGVGAVWRPSLDRNAISKGGKSRISMVMVGQSRNLCLGMIWERHFCLSESNCKTKLHAKKFKMGSECGWFIPSKSQVLIGGAMAFTAPFLDAAKITDDTLATLKNSLICNTTVGWEDFIMEAQEEWVEFDA
jgi:hypothetical protein